MAKSYLTSELLGELSQFEKKNSPSQLFVEGDTALLTKGRRIAIVGSRKASSEGIRRARVLAATLVEQGFIIVSGLAAGIDAAAHRSAIESGGKTIAVLGTPLSVAYPKENTALLAEIKRNHLAISQFPEGHNTLPKDFPIRNRTMALISDATVVVEATENSGTRHQGWEALRMGRELYLLENIVKSKHVKWAAEMLKYGALELDRDSVNDLQFDVPNFTERAELVF